MVDRSDVLRTERLAERLEDAKTKAGHISRYLPRLLDELAIPEDQQSRIMDYVNRKVANILGL